MRKILVLITLLILVFGPVSAQSNLRQKAYEAKKVEAAYWDAVSSMYRCILFEDTYIPCFCYPLLDRVWVHTFVSLDGNLRVNIFYDNNGKVGDIFYTAIIQSYEAAKPIEDIDTVVPSIEMKLDNGNLTFIQDETGLYKFDILIW